MENDEYCSNNTQPTYTLLGITKFEEVSLGQGYSTNTSNVLYRNCFDISNSKINTVRLRSNVKEFISYKEISEELGIDLGLDLKIVKISPIFKLARKFKESSHSLSAFFSATVTFRTTPLEKITQENFNIAGEEKYKSGVQQFIKYCGDKIITQIDKSAKLVIGVRVNFGNSQLKSNFLATNSLNSLLTNIEANNNYSSVEMYTHQLGGETLAPVQKTCYDVDSCKEALNDARLLLDKFLEIIKLDDYLPITEFTTLSPIEEIIDLTEEVNRSLNEDYISIKNNIYNIFKDLNTKKYSIEEIYERGIDKNLALNDIEKLKLQSSRIDNIISAMIDDNGIPNCLYNPIKCNELENYVKNTIKEIDSDFINHFFTAVKITIRVDTWLTWPEKLTIKILPSLNEKAYQYYNSMDDKSNLIILKEDSALILRIIEDKYKCPKLEYMGGNYKTIISEEQSKCLVNWFSYCNYLTCTGEITGQIIDVFD